MHENFLKKGSCWVVVAIFRVFPDYIPLLDGLAFTNVFNFYNVIMARNKNHVLIHWHGSIIKIPKTIDIFRLTHLDKTVTLT